MSKLVKQTELELKEKIMDALGRAVADGVLDEAPLPAFIIEVPKERQNGDYSTNVAMAGAKAFHKAPRVIAQAIVDRLDLADTVFDRAEIAGPGFINFFLGNRFYAAVLEDLMAQGENYGRSDYGKGKRVLVEFVSANPTGPMHIGNARGGAIGDCLAAVLDWAGYDVQREFYVNDAGNQIEKFATSLEVRYLQHYDPAVELPEDAYKGVDIVEHAENFIKEYGDRYVNAPAEERRKALVDYALPKNIAGLERDLGAYRIQYDRWFKESSLHEDGSVQRVIDALKEKGVTYEQDGALWFKASAFGNDKDIVLVRANGIPTYIVPDIAYHYNKLVTRGYDKAVDVLGADHHGYVPRMKAALTALGLDADRLDCVIMQMVRLVRDGETIKLSKRSGKAITLNTLLEEVPIDAARFFFNLREPNSHFDFDLELAASTSNENPVYYVQYAHARICTLLKNLEAEGYTVPAADAVDFSLLTDETEQALIKQIASYGQVVLLAARDYDPSHINRYLTALAAAFHKFYAACRIKGEEKPVLLARLKLADTTRAVLKNAMTLIGCSAPEKM